MDRKKTIDVKGKKVSLAYITEEEKKLLLERDKAKGSIAEKFHKGIPVLNGDPALDPDYDAGTEEGVPGDDNNGDNGDNDGGDAPELNAEETCNARSGYHWDSETNTCVPDEEEVDTPESCAAKGEPWYWDEETQTCTIDESWEKAPAYTPAGEEDKVSKPGSETERVQAKREIGTDFADSVAETMKGEVEGLGAKSAELRGLDISREAQDAQLAAAQQWAAKGMSFSTPMLHAEEDFIRDLSIKRLINEDQAQAMQAKLDLQAWNNSEPIQKLAAASKLSATGQPGGFQPGEIDVSEVMDPDFSNITIPGFSGLPENISKIFVDYNENPLYKLGENITDPAGNVCDYNELDDNGYCPTQVQENIMDTVFFVLKFLGILGGNAANKASLAIQQAQFALQMAESADQEKIARRQVKRATDQANVLLAKSDLKGQYEAALQDLADKGVTDAQAVADDFAKLRTDVGKEYLGGDDPSRESKLQLLRDSREQGMLDAVGDEGSIGGQFSGANVAGVPSAWSNAFNKSAERIYGEMETRAGLRADLGSTGDMDLMTAMGGTKLQGADLGEDAMTKALGVDYQLAESDIETAMRKKSGVGTATAPGFAQKGHDIDFGYTLPTTVMGGIDPNLTTRLTKAQNQQAMFSGLGDIASYFMNK